METDIKVLVVDDDDLAGGALLLGLEAYNFTAEHIMCPKKALLETYQQDWDIIITDYNMPELNGCQLCIQLKRLIPKVPIIILHTGNIDGVKEDTRIFDAVIEKPAKIQKYIDTINMLYLSQSKQLT